MPGAAGQGEDSVVRNGLGRPDPRLRLSIATRPKRRGCAAHALPEDAAMQEGRGRRSL